MSAAEDGGGYVPSLAPVRRCSSDMDPLPGGFTYSIRSARSFGGSEGDGREGQVTRHVSLCHW